MSSHKQQSPSQMKGEQNAPGCAKSSKDELKDRAAAAQVAGAALQANTHISMATRLNI